MEAIAFDAPDEVLALDFDDVILTKGRDNAFSAIPPERGYGAYADVITDLQFERMLSPTGPTDGMVLSPLDGEIPSRLAIVQAEPDAGEDHLLSSVVLGVNEAILALDRTDGLAVSLISPLCDAFKAQFLSDSEKVQGLSIAEGTAVSVQRGSEGGPLTLTYSQDGKDQTASVDMVVLLTKPVLSAEISALSKKLDKSVL